MKDLSHWRDKFDSVRHCHWLISNSLGAMPNEASEALSRFAALWRERGARSWEEEWWMLSREVGDVIGDLMNAPPNSVTMMPNVTTAEAVVQSCFDLNPPRNKVVMVDMEFPSLLYLYREWLRDRGELVVISSGDGITVDTEMIVDAIDESTLLVPISHVLFRSAYIVDVKAIIEKAHRVGAKVVLDVFQSLGAVPVDVSQLNADFVVGGCLKWLCGGPGACFLYVHPDLADSLNPRFTGWLSHENPFEFNTGPIERTSGSYRFLNGTPAIPALYACRPGLDIIREIGIDRIRARSTEMTDLIVRLAGERGWAVTAPTDVKSRGGTIALNLERAADIAATLNARDFLVDYRPKAGVRVSPHFYNTDSEIKDLFEMIERIEAEGYPDH